MTLDTQNTPPAPPPARDERRRPGAALLTLGGALCVAGLCWSATSALRRESDATRDEAPAAKAARYACPMHPSYQRDEPERCPVCEMRMTAQVSAPAEPGAVQDHARVALSPSALQRIGVRTELVEARRCTRTLRVPAHVEVDEKGLSAVSLKTSGWVEELFARAEGELVEPGQPLFTLYSPDLFESQRKYILASTLLAQNAAAGGEELDATKRQRVEAARARLALWDMTDEQVAALERPGAEPLRTTPILARDRGVIVARNVVRGGHVEPGETLFELADLARVWVIAQVPESELALVAGGAPAEVELVSAPGAPIAGTVDYVYPILDGATRTARVRLVLDNPDCRLLPGMYATVSIAVDLGDALLVDDEAVLDTGTRRLVFVEVGPGEFEPRAVEVAERRDGRARVVAGLEDGERVVTRATFLVDSESRLQAVLSSPAAAPPESPARECAAR